MPTTPAATSTPADAVNPLTKSGSAKKKLSADMDNFLKLLTTQLRHQDPLEPLDTNKFTEQLVQFASVEQQIAANENLEKMLKIQDTNQIMSALNYLGKTVDIEGSTVALKDGQALIRFTGEKAAASAGVSILNAQGKEIQRLSAPPGSGPQSVTWNGLTFDGRAMPPGDYSIRVDAKDAAGNPIARSTLISGLVDSVSGETDNLALMVGGQAVKPSQVKAVRQPASSSN